MTGGVARSSHYQMVPQQSVMEPVGTTAVVSMAIVDQGQTTVTVLGAWTTGRDKEIEKNWQ